MISTIAAPPQCGWINVGGKTVEYNAIALLRFEDNRIAEECVVHDEPT
jgi:hypothetical protein